MSTIQVGDTVEWKPKYKRKGAPDTLTGVVKSLHGGRKPWAAVHVTIVQPAGFWCVDIVRLTRVAAN